MGGVRIFILLMLSVLLSGIAAMLPFALSGADALESSYREYAVRDMTANANLFAISLDGAAGGAPSGMSALAETAGKRSATRFTVIAPDGRVVADSEEDAGRMENHSNRLEVAEALAGKTGVDVRKSPTLGTDWIYVAIPHGGGSVVRAAASLDDLNDRLGQWWGRAVAGFGVSLAVLAVMAFFMSRMLSRPIEAAAAGAERYARGDLSYRLPATGPAEVRRLAEAMGAMAEELDARFRLVNRQREEMRAVFDNMSEGVLAVDGDGRVILVNGAARSILDLPPEVDGADIGAVFRNADLLAAIRDAAVADAPVEREIRMSRDGRDESLVQVHAARIRGDGRDAGALAVLRDVTRLRRLEVMRRDFVANVSHELRTPITAIQSSLETVVDDGEGGEFAAMALRNARRMGAIIDNLLFLAGMESGVRKDTGKVGVNPVLPVLNEAISLCGEDARSRRMAFSVECEDGLTAFMSPQLVVHALVNLIDNAIKYGPEAGVVGITAKREGDRAAITVSDEGPGIPSRYHSRVFERFYRMDGTTRIKKGSGLGLAIVKHIALAQGGDIRLESEIGTGSRFILDLPL